MWWLRDCRGGVTPYRTVRLRLAQVPTTGVELTRREHMRLHNWGRCVMAEINAVLARLTAEELEETSQLGRRGTWGGS
ncbi:hypothetical protein D9M72_597160 [compost metagenome]